MDRSSPALGEYELPGYLDGRAMAEMLSAEMEIGSHGWSHVDWRRADDAVLTRETVDARERMRRRYNVRWTVSRFHSAVMTDV